MRKLTLHKPALDDYVDVEKDLNENYRKIEEWANSSGTELDNKFDDGGVSTDYDTAKKMEDKIKFLATQIEKTPIGTILPFASGTIPKDYLLCDGREITKNDYSELYDILPFGGYIDEKVFRGLAKNEVPNMTGPTLNGYTITESSVFSATFPGWKAFDSITSGDNGGWASLTGQKEGWVQIQYPNKRALSSFTIKTRTYAPGSKLEKISVNGVTTTSEDELFTENLSRAFTTNEKREFKVNFNKKTYDKFKIKVSAPNDQYCAIDEIELFTVDITQFPNHKQETTKKYLPDLRGQFLRGIKDGRKLLDWESEDIKKHNHKEPLAYPPESSVTNTLKEYTEVREKKTIFQTLMLDDNVNDNVYGRPIAKETYEGNETRPSNIGVNYIIKAKNGINDNSIPAYIESLLNDLNELKNNIEYTNFLDITSFEMKKPSGSSIVTSNIHLLSKPFYALNFIGSYIESLNENRFKVELVTSFYENSGGFGESGFSKKAEITKEISETTNKWIRFCIKLDKEYDDISAVKKELNRELQTNIKLYRERDSFSNYIQNKFETVHSGKVLKINSDGTVSPKNAYLNGNGFMQNKGGYAYADPFDVDKFINTSDRDTFFVSVKTLKNALHYADSAFGMSPTGNINSMFIKDKATHKNYAYELHNKEFILKNVQKYLPDVRTDRVLVWNEEFSGDKIDTDIWKIEDKVPNNSELSVIENVSVMDSICTLTSKYGEVEHKGKRYNRTGASISTKNSVLFNKGLIEAKIRVSSNGGEWTGFWLMGDAQWSFCGEIDISEYYQAYNKSEATLHFFNSSNQDDKTPSSIIPVNNVREWNIYGCEIKENEVNIFVNNQLVKKFDTSTLDLAKVFSSDERGFNPFNFLDKFIILTLGSTSTSSKSTNTLEIDWVRLYAPEEEKETELDYTSYYITCPCDTDTVNHQSEITVNLSEAIKLYGYSCFPAWCVSDKNNDIKYVRFTSNNESVIKPNGRDATMVIYGRGKCNITATDNKGNKVTRAFNVI